MPNYQRVRLSIFSLPAWFGKQKKLNPPPNKATSIFPTVYSAPLPTPTLYSWRETQARPRVEGEDEVGQGELLISFIRDAL